MWTENNNYSATARNFNINPSTVKRVVEADPQMQEKAEHKKEENTQDVLDYMDSKTNSFKKFSDYILDERLDPIKNKEELDKIPINQLITVYGVTADKFLKVKEVSYKTKSDSNLETINQGIQNIADILANPVPNRELPDE